MGLIDSVASGQVSAPAAVPTVTNTPASPPSTGGLPAFQSGASSGGTGTGAAPLPGAGTERFIQWQTDEYARLLDSFQVGSSDSSLSFPGYYQTTYDGTLDFDNVYPRRFVDGQNLKHDANKQTINSNYNIGFADAMQEYYSNDEKRGDYQMLLFYAGYLEKPPSNPGAFNDPKSLAAWERAVRDASFRQEGLFDMLTGQARQRNEAGLNKTGTGKGNKGPLRPTVQVISDEDAQEVLDNIAKSELGRKLSDSEEKVAKSIIKAMKDKQASEQNAYIDQSMKGGGVVDAPTNPQTTAKNEVEGQFEDESKTYDLAQAFANLVGISGGGS